jgi:hypothetical protein
MRCNLFLLVLALLVGCGSQDKSLREPAKTGQTGPFPPEVVAAPPLEDGFTALSLQDFVPFHGDEKTWTERDGLLICSGTPKGYVHTREPYSNFTLRGDFAYELTDEQKQQPEKANTGFMIAIQEPHKVWPASLEVQGRMDKVCSINPNGGVSALTMEDHPDVRERIKKPAGEWNRVEIVVRDGAITARLNGELICTSQPGELKEGLLGLQSEGYLVKFRNLRVRRD